MNIRNLLLASAAFTLAMTSQSALAQSAADGAASDRNADIIVTARKKQESILKVPVVENVLTEAVIERYQIRDLQDITTKIPGLVSGNAVLAIGEQMSLRGVGSNSLDQGVDQSVSLNIDGLQLSHGLAYRAAAFDLQQVEVLKGPQALYFGKNSTAGVISFRTADPGDSLEIKGSIGYEFEAREKRGELVVSGPLSDTLGLRVGGVYSNSEGIFKNTATAQPGFGGKNPKYSRLGGGESYLVRGTLLWKPSDVFTARVKANFARDKMRSGGLNQLVDCPDGTGSLPGNPWNFYHPTEDCKFDKTVNFIDLDPAAFPGIRNNGTPFLDLKQNFGTVELSYDLSPELALTSVSGLYDAKADTMINGTFAGYAGPAISADNIFKRHEFTQELRLESDFKDSAINFSTGGFYQKGTISNDFTLGGNQSFLLSQLSSTLPAAPILAATLVKGISTIHLESISLFGQLRFKASDQFEIAGGARWQQEKRNLDVFNRVSNTVTVLAPGTDRINSKNWSPELTLTYTPSNTVTVFAAFKQAYKSGSFNIVIPGNPGENKRFGDEKVQGGEIGLKSRLADRALSFDVAAYYYRYAGLQTGVNEPAVNGLPVLRTVNAGKAEIYGVDLEMSYRPPTIDGLSINLAANWNKTKFLELNNVPCYGGQLASQGCNQFLNTATGRFTSQNLAGVPFVRAPEWRINFGFDYEMPVGDSMRFVLANDNQYSSSYLAILGNPAVRPNTVQPGALKMDLSLTLYGKGDRWSIGVVGKNLTDKLRAGYCSSYNAAGGSIFTAPIAGGTVRNASGQDELGCSTAAGRAVSVRVGFKY
jgi:iron complex outermembrane recepter protein